MPKRKVVVDFDEIFHFAKQRHGLEWNPCCDIFHGGCILTNQEGKNVTICLEDVKSNLEWDEENKNSGYNYSPEQKKGWKIVVEYMEENNLKEMYVDND